MPLLVLGVAVHERQDKDTGERRKKIGHMEEIRKEKGPKVMSVVQFRALQCCAVKCRASRTWQRESMTMSLHCAEDRVDTVLHIPLYILYCKERNCQDKAPVETRDKLP